GDVARVGQLAGGRAAQPLVHAHGSAAGPLVVVGECWSARQRTGAHRAAGRGLALYTARHGSPNHCRSLLYPSLSVLSPGVASGAAGTSHHTAYTPDCG